MDAHDYHVDHDWGYILLGCRLWRFVDSGCSFAWFGDSVLLLSRKRSYDMEKVSFCGNFSVSMPDGCLRCGHLGIEVPVIRIIVVRQ